MTSTLFCLCLLAASQAGDAPGVLEGVVLNGSAHNAPLANAEVMLCIENRGERVPVDQAATDAQGRFAFTNLPVDEELVFLPGANRGGIHYPGPRVRLSELQPRASVELVAFDTISDPSPLVALEHHIVVKVESGVLRVSESLLIDNPSLTAYVGEEISDMPPVTLRLSIPEDFEKVTFQKEFYGRQFLLIDGRVITSIPWPPGQRKLEYTYSVPIEKKQRVLERRLDLPTRQCSVTVLEDDGQHVACNLPRQATSQPGEIVFAAGDKLLPAGHAIELQLGKLPVPLMAYARWLALVVLGVLVLFSWRLLGRDSPRRPLAPRDGTPHAERKACYGRAT